MYIVYHQSLSTIPSKKYSIYTSSINICCCVSKFMRPRSFQQETQLECDCCCWTSYNHTSNICFYKTTFDLIFKCIPSRKCHCQSLLLYHTLYTSNRVMNRTGMLANEGDLPIIRRRLIVTSSAILLFKLWISRKESCCVYVSS